MEFEVLLPEKLKQYNINNSLDVIEAFQSYDVDWGFYLVDYGLDKIRLETSEKISPFPTTSGGLCFLQFFFEEEKFLEEARKYVSKRVFENLMKLIKTGYPASEYIPEDVFLRILKSNENIIHEVLFEMFIPVDSYEKEDLYIEKHGDLKDISTGLLKTDYYFLHPSVVKSCLEESLYVHEYLQKIAERFTSATKNEGYLFVVRGYFPAKKTFKDLERSINSLLSTLNIRYLPRTLLFNRIITG